MHDGSMTNTNARKTIQARGYQVRLPRRNGVRAAVEITMLRSEPEVVVMTAGGATDAEAWANALAMTEVR